MAINEFGFRWITSLTYLLVIVIHKFELESVVSDQRAYRGRG